MGWTFSPSWKSQKDVEQHIVNSMAYGYQCIAKSSKFGEMYAAIQRPDGEVFILVALIRTCKGEWGYKDMEEDMMPFYYNCTEKVLKLSTMNDSNSVRWRAKCRNHRADVNAKKRLLRAAEKDQVVATTFGKVQFKRFLNKSQTGFVGVNVESGRLYRYNVKDLILDEK